MDTLTTISPTDLLANERRLVSRVLRHWHDPAKDRRCPSEGQINPTLVGDDWANCAIMRLDPKLDHFSFVVVGANLLPPRHDPIDGQPISACPAHSLLGVLVKYLPRFHPNGGPLSVSGTVTHGPGPVLFRAVLLPLSEDGTHIDSVLGAANFRELRKGEDKALHTRLQVAILAVEKGQIWEVFNPLWGGWSRAVVTKVDQDRATVRQKTGLQTLVCKPDDMTRHPEKYRFIAYV
jgi:hypothetical protein